MELKDVILSTIAEMEEVSHKPQTSEFAVKEKITLTKPIVENKEDSRADKDINNEEDTSSSDSELMYLNSIKERLLVLFEGFQAPNNTNIEAKVDMTLNFLEYTLATIDQRVKILEKRKR